VELVREMRMEKRRVTVVARIKAKPGFEEALRKELLALIAPTSRERGCISYDLHESVEDNALFMFYENWCSREDLDEHLDQPHLRAFMDNAEALLAEPVDISLWEMIE
jgi:quinol monooxygenase YgiN